MKNNPFSSPFILALFASSISLSTLAQNQISFKELSSDKIPKEIKYEGNIKSIIGWNDKLGENLLILTETGKYISKKFAHESDGKDAELFAYHYLIQSDNTKQTWKVYDYISDCPYDIEANFLKNSNPITDLNNDGIAETWLIYKKVCHSDVSPATMKIIMYQGTQKYALRGENKVEAGKDSNGNQLYIGGDYTYDQAFATGPKAFLDFAKNLWEKNIFQTWGE